MYLMFQQLCGQNEYSPSWWGWRGSILSQCRHDSIHYRKREQIWGIPPVWGHLGRFFRNSPALGLLRYIRSKSILAGRWQVTGQPFALAGGLKQRISDDTTGGWRPGVKNSKYLDILAGGQD